MHLRQSASAEAVEALLHGQQAPTIGEHLFSAQVWFESFQNWQSEFLSTAVLVVLSIFLRFRGSPDQGGLGPSLEDRCVINAGKGGEHLPTFYFRTTDQEGFSAEDRGFDFPDEQTAIAEAKVTLAEMAADGLPQEPISMIGIKVLDQRHVLLVELRLVLEIIPNTDRAAHEAR